MHEKLNKHWCGIIIDIEVLPAKFTTIVFHPLLQEEFVVANHGKYCYLLQFICFYCTKIDKKTTTHK